MALKTPPDFNPLFYMPAASLGIDFAVLHALQIWAVALVPVPDQPAQLRDLVFREERADLGETDVLINNLAARLPPNVSDVFMPWTNYDRSDSIYLWRGWIEASAVCVLADPKAAPVRVSLETPVKRLIRPALSVESGDMDVPLLADGGRQLVLVRFQMPTDSSPARGSVAWTLPLDRAPAGARAAVGPSVTGSVKKAALIFGGPRGVSVQVFDLPAAGKPGEPLRLDLPDFEPLPGADPGIFIDGKNVAHVSVIVAARGNPEDLFIVDIRFPRSAGDVIEREIHRIRKLPGPPVAAGVSWQSLPDQPMRRDWAILLLDGTVLHSLSENPPAHLQGVPSLPLEIVTRSRATYILTVGPGGPLLESLE